MRTSEGIILSWFQFMYFLYFLPYSFTWNTARYYVASRSIARKVSCAASISNCDFSYFHAIYNRQYWLPSPQAYRGAPKLQ